MSHDRGRSCGREKWEYADCKHSDCIRNKGMTFTSSEMVKCSPKELKTVTITKEVPVNDLETLEAWLNNKLSHGLSREDEEAYSRGTKVLKLIQEAGFTIQPPITYRQSGLKGDPQ